MIRTIPWSLVFNLKPCIRLFNDFYVPFFILFYCIDYLLFSDMEYLEVLTEGLERVLMVRGGGREVITIYS